MENFLDEFPQNWTNPEFMQLRDLLVVCADNERFLRDLAQLAGIRPGTFPGGYSDVYSIVTELIRVMGEQGKLRKLVEVAAGQDIIRPDYRRQFAEMLTLPPVLPPVSPPAGAQSPSEEISGRRPSSEPRAPFIGLLPYRFADVDLFFGRDRHIDGLIGKLTAEHTPLLIINGLSGVGKTSLLRAGLVPRLRQLEYSVAYSQILDSPRSDVLRGISNAFDMPLTDASLGIVEALDAVKHVSAHPLVLIIDQLERCFRSSQGDVEYTSFWKDIARVLGGGYRHEVQLILSVRSDWLHAFQTVPLNVPVFDFLFLLNPLTEEEAKDALSGPLKYFNIAYEPELIEEVVSDLAFQKESVNPPELQIVGLALYRHAREFAADGSIRLTVDDYNKLQGARTIIRNHLVNTVNNLGPSTQECWQILLRLVGPENQRISKHTEELRGNLALQDFDNIIANLEQAHLVTRQISSRDNRPVYTLPHDYLVEEINKYVEQDLELQAWRTAEHYLEQGLIDWRNAPKHTHQDESAELLLERTRYRYIWAHRAGFGPLAADVYLFLLSSALYHGDETFHYWLEQMPPESLLVAFDIVRDTTLYAAETEAAAAQQAVLKAERSELLSDEQGRALKDIYWPVFRHAQSAPDPDSSVANLLPHSAVRRAWEASASILWALRKHATTQEELAIAPVVARLWLRRHRSHIGIAIFSAVLVIGIVSGAWWVNQSLRGEWVAANSLIAGPVSAVAFAPTAPETLYALVPRGPNVGDGATLVRREGSNGAWEVISRSLTYAPVMDLLITPSEKEEPRIYLSIYGEGIIRSDDAGRRWKLINNGLFSYAIYDLAADPDNPEVLYAVAGDAKGVFRSTDGGDSWQDISGAELFGASALTIVYTKFGGGKWLVGTADGRIVAQEAGGEDWRRVSTFPGAGAIVALAVEELDGQEIYAGTSNGMVLFSFNGGENWVPLDKIDGVFAVNSLAVVSGMSKQVFMSAFGVGGHIVWKQSTDNGASWQQIEDHRFTREALRLISHPQQAQKLYAVGMPGLFETQNGGQEWMYHDRLPAPIVAASRIAISPLANGPTYVATGGAVFHSHTPQRGGWGRGRDLPALLVRDIVVDPGDVSRAVASVYLPNRWSVFITEDSGATWAATARPTEIPERYLNDTMAVAAARSDDALWLYVGINGCGVLFSPDGGQSWDTFGRADCTLPSETPKSVIDLVVDPFSPTRIYAAADSTRMYISDNQGRAWTARQVDVTTPISAIVADPQLQNRLYLIAGSSGFWRSDDAAETWTHLSNGLEDKIIIAVVAVPGRAETLFIAASNGEVWQTTDGGQRWRPITENLTVSRASALAYDERNQMLALGAEGDGLYWYRAGTWLPWARNMRPNE